MSRRSWLKEKILEYLDQTVPELKAEVKRLREALEKISEKAEAAHDGNGIDTHALFFANGWNAAAKIARAALAESEVEE